MNEIEMKNYINQIIDIWKKESLNNPILEAKMQHSERVAQYVQLITETQSDSFYGWVHDIGRIEQYHKIKSFDDNKYNHGIAGIDYIYNNNIQFLKDFEEAKDIIKYHSNYNTAPEDKKTYLLYCVTIADQLDNALTCKNYILEEEKNNSKNFIKANHFSSYFLEGINNHNIYLDKKECNTYLDYFYFAFTLLLRSLDNKDIRKILKTANSEKIQSSFDFFQELFKDRLDGEIRDKVLDIIKISRKDI